MARKRQRAILIAGPTASGKSAAALALARSIGGVIINADAIQVYRELKVLSARPGPEEETMAPHRLFGHVPASEPYSAGRWLEDAERALREAWESSVPAIVVGGTGLYFRSLDKGLVAMPPVPQHVRAKWRNALAEQGPQALHAELARLSPEEAARLKPSDGQRIARSLEVIEATGEPLFIHQRRRQGSAVLAGAEVVRIAIVPDREVLYRRCDARFLQMIEQGALHEVGQLMMLNLDPAFPAMKAIGVQPLARHLSDEISLEEAIRVAQRDTRNYAKRQLTWLRHQMPSFEPVKDADDALKRALDLCCQWA